MRYGRQPLSEIMKLTSMDRRRLIQSIEDLIEKENTIGTTEDS